MIYRVVRAYAFVNYGSYRYSSNAYERGYQDGLYTGANDGRRGQDYNPERSHFYREAGSGFFSFYGGRDTYNLAYRDGFVSGYNEGYENFDFYFSGGSFHQ